MTLRRIMRRIMSRVGTPALWSHFNLKGRNRKKAFDATIYRQIKRAARKVHGIVFNEGDFEVKEAVTLKNAPNRKGGSHFEERLSFCVSPGQQAVRHFASDDSDFLV